MALAALTFTAAIPAEQNNFDYDEIVLKTFWGNLYPEGGWTLYCGFRFGPDRRTVDGRPVDIDHVYPTERMLKFAGCGNRTECRERENKRFSRMEADLHNLYPVWQPLVTFRNGRWFGVVDGEDRRFDDCDIEWRNGVLEPRPLARGNIARAILYMHSTYKLPIDAAGLKLLKDWNREDPPSEQEQIRNDRIEVLQGKRNPFIDKPALADRLNTEKQ